MAKASSNPTPPVAPLFERDLGLETFYTRHPGVGGRLRDSPQDFHVTELYQLPPSSEAGRFTIAKVTSTNWETHTLVQALADQLHIHPRRIAFAGTKDRRAVTSQLMSFVDVDSSILASCLMKDVSIVPLQKAEAPLQLGQLIGNRFAITIHKTQATQVALQELLSPFQDLGGFPNFFGVQRFGGIRPITHIVGRYLTQGDFEAAVMTYVAHPLPTDPEEVHQLRAALKQSRDFAAAYASYPKSLNFERLMLERLARNPSDFIDAIQALPKNLLLMFVNAYQSYMFNRMLSERIRQSLPLHEAVAGDTVVPVRDGRLQETLIPVSEANLAKVNLQIHRQKAAVVGLLYGSDSTLSTGAMGEIERHILDEEKLEARAFIIPEVPLLSSSGTWRRFLAPLSDLSWTVGEDAKYPGTAEVHLDFELVKGCYATSLLRELMKAPKASDY